MPRLISPPSRCAAASGIERRRLPVRNRLFCKRGYVFSTVQMYMKRSVFPTPVSRRQGIYIKFAFSFTMPIMPGGNNKDLHLRHILYAMHFPMPRCEAFRRERAKRKPRVLLLTRGFRLVFSSFSCAFCCFCFFFFFFNDPAPPHISSLSLLVVLPISA